MPIRRYPLVEQTAAELLSRIGEGEWPVGSKLPGETTLAARLGVGRSTVREAIRDLAGRGVLESRQGSGVLVLATDVRDEWEAVLRQADIAHVVEARAAIETQAARSAALRRTPADIRSLRARLAARDEAAASATDEVYVEADIDFHRSVVVAAHNPVLLELFETFVPRNRRSMIDVMRMRGAAHRSAADLDAHSAIVDAIVARTPDAAADIARAHLAELEEGVR